MLLPDFSRPGPWLDQLSGLSTPVIAGAAVAHVLAFVVLWWWYGRDLRIIAGCLDEFTRGLQHRSVLGRAAPLTSQIDAFVQDIADVLSDPQRGADRVQCLQRLNILDERRSYLDSLSFETFGNIARTMIESYPLAGVLGTILAIGSALQTDQASPAAALTGTAGVPVVVEAASADTMARIVDRFGDAIWSTFAGLCAAMLLMFINSLLEPRFARLTACRSHVRDVVARAKRELGMAIQLSAAARREQADVS